MKIAFICDIHMPQNINSPQYAFFLRAVKQLKKDGIKTVVGLGDIVSYGEPGAMAMYQETMQNFESYVLLGNAEVRNSDTKELFLNNSQDVCIEYGGRKILGLNSPSERLTNEDRDNIKSLCDGDILLMHHGLHAFCDEDCGFLTKCLYNKKLTFIHAHSHKKFDYSVGKSRVIGLRALDPDKSIGDFPCITYIDISEENIFVEEKAFEVSREVLSDIRRYFGISCVDNHRDLEYATKNKVGALELRCNSRQWSPDMTLMPKLEAWRKKTNGYLSVHMPNLKWDGEKITGIDQWKEAVNYATTINADGLTMHPPRVKKCDMPQDGEVWQAFLDLYVYAVKNVGDNVKIGIENLHMSGSEISQRVDANELRFGYTPEEVSLWIDAINESIGKPNRVGHLLDVGHARSNGSYASIYTSSRWYEIMGKKTVGYHIHQVISVDGNTLNHNAIENWFGPLISYVSFFYAWEQNMINHVPVFLEVKGAENFEKSMQSFDRKFTKK